MFSMEIIIGYLHSGLSAIIPFVILLGLLILCSELGAIRSRPVFRRPS